MPLSIGYDAPLIGPVLLSTAESLQTANVTVQPTGNSITVSVNSVSPFIHGNSIAVSMGTVSVVIGVPVSGNTIAVTAGSVSVQAGGSANVGVGGEAIAVSVGAVSVTGDANVTPATSQMDVIVGQAAVQRSATVNASGNAITVSGGIVQISFTITVGRAFDRTTANLRGVIDDLVVEDDYDLERTITGIPDGSTLVRAWLTIKSIANADAADSAAVIQKTITTLPVNGQGQITDAIGGTLLFQLSKADTLLLLPQELYVYDIQVESSTGKFSTREKGILTPIQQVTQYP